MRTKIILAFAVVLSLTTVAAAQTKMSGAVHCAKPDPQHMIQVGDRPNHSFAIAQEKCTWTKPAEIGGVQTKEYVSTFFSNISGDRSRNHGYAVEKLSNGEYRVSFQGPGTLKDGVPQTYEGKWSFIGGSGKFKGIKGGGTYTCKAVGEESNCDIEGEYQLPK